MSSPRPILSVEGLVKTYPGVTALSGVDFDVMPGEVHCLVGQNGAGKSTLIKSVSGVVSPTEGRILVDGEPVPPGDPNASIAAGVATIYQELDLVADLSIAQNVFLGHEPRRGPFLDRRRMAEETTALLGRLDHGHLDPGTLVGDLRPAQQQVVSIARALSRDARLLIMDEPSAVLDDTEIEVLFAIVERLTAGGVGVVYISHRLGEVNRIGDRVTVIRNGATVATGLPTPVDPDELIGLMVGQPLEDLFPGRGDHRGEAVLQVRDLTRRPDVIDVSFDAHAGEVLGIAGLVGAGRTELLRAIYGLDRPDCGTVTVSGYALPPGRPDLAVAAGIGLAPEERKSQGLVLDWSLTKNVSLADLAAFTRSGFVDRARERQTAHAKLRDLATHPDDPDRLARELSGGNQQKVVLARWLMRDCRVLLLDEPTRGVDVGAKAEIYRVIRELADAGIAVVMVSSELPEIVGFCDRILVVADGALVAEGDGREMTEQDILRHCVHTH